MYLFSLRHLPHGPTFSPECNPPPPLVYWKKTLKMPANALKFKLFESSCGHLKRLSRLPAPPLQKTRPGVPQKAITTTAVCAISAGCSCKAAAVVTGKNGSLAGYSSIDHEILFVKHTVHIHNTPAPKTAVKYALSKRPSLPSVCMPSVYLMSTDSERKP